MGYDRLGPSVPGGSDNRPDHQEPAMSHSELRTNNTTNEKKKKTKLILLSLLALALLLAAVVSVSLFVGLRTLGSDRIGPNLIGKPTRAIARTCSKTRYPTLCINSLLEVPASHTANERDLVNISFNVTLQRFTKAFYNTSAISYLQMPPRVRSAFDDCLELLDDSIDTLSNALSSVVSGGGGREPLRSDVVTWLSAAMTNQDTCTEGFDGVGDVGGVKQQIAGAVKDLSELVSNCLAIFSGSIGDLSGVPVENRRKLLEIDEKFPRWLGRRERELLGTPATKIQADIIVSKDGNGTFKTITEAIKKAPEHSSRRIIIYVKAGR